MDLTFKECSKCGVCKPVSSFGLVKNVERRVSSQCKACRALAAAEYRKSHPEKAKAAGIAWRLKNSDHQKAAVKLWREANPERYKAANSAWKKNNPEQHKAHRHARRAKKIAVGGAYTSLDLKQILALQRGMCPVCKKLLGSKYHIDHILPLYLGGTNDKSNLQLLHQSCNSQKNAKHPIDFMQSKGFLL